MRPNARGKPHRSTKCGGYQQAELVGVGLTKQLGWWQVRRRVSYAYLTPELAWKPFGSNIDHTVPQGNAVEAASGAVPS
jgi:hypothetical protein